MKKRSKSTWSFPIDLISEILLRLPAKSVRRFRCVSKLWSSITTDPCFIKSFETRSLTRPSLLLCVENDDNLFVSSIPQHTHQNADRSYCSSQHIRTGYHMEFLGYFPLSIESVHGLVCFKKSQNPVVWNPSTRQFLTLPEPKFSSRSRRSMVFFGYDPVEGKHKVVCVPYKKTCYVCRVFTLGSAQKSWRTVRAKPKHRAYSGTTGRCINVVIYYAARIRDETLVWVIMSFDVRSEKFHMIKGPSGNSYWDVLITYEGKLACSDLYNKTRLWILEDAEKHKWSFRDFLSPLCNDRCLSVSRDSREDLGILKLKGSTHTGEFIYVPDMFHKPSFILFYDPVRNSCRRLQFEGIADDESKVSRYELSVFPNHIESLMSL